MSSRFASRAGLFVACLSIAAATHAQEPLPERVPGLWELTMNRGSPMADMLQGMQEALAQMPEEQRKQMEQMLAQSGASLAQPDVVRQCLTAEEARREFEPVIDDADMKCSKIQWSGSGAEGRYSMTCTSPDGDWKVSGRIWDATPKSYKSEMTMEGVMEGQSMTMEISHEARWVGPDCQGLKPAS